MKVRVKEIQDEQYKDRTQRWELASLPPWVCFRSRN
jgi:hypothetical protein